MKIYSQKSEYTLLQGNMLDMLEVIGGGTIDSIVTDPPYGLTSIVKRFGKENSAPCKEGKDGSFARLSKGFMGKEWDGSGIEYNVDAWRKCYEVLKPGGYLLAFGGSRTYHRIACAIEDAGFEIRDCIMWLYGSGFPKSLNIGLAIDKKNGVESIDTGIQSPNARPNCDKTNTLYESGTVGKNFTIKKAANERAGWGTALKPSYEPIIVARKPLEGSCTDNVIKYGVGGINIDECRVFGEDLEELQKNWTNRKAPAGFNGDKSGIYGSGKTENTSEYKPSGRFPANTILTYDESDFDEVCGGFPNTKSRFEERNDKHDFKGNKDAFTYGYKKRIGSGFNDEGSAARYFYCAKASRRDRDEGLPEGEHSTHPTVKPTDLMQYLVRLVTPNGGTVLDPFNGSGSTGKAVMYENKDRNKNYKYIGIELTEEYLPIAKARIEYVINKGIEKEKSDPKQEEQTKQRKESALF